MSMTIDSAKIPLELRLEGTGRELFTRLVAHLRDQNEDRLAAIGDAMLLDMPPQLLESMFGEDLGPFAASHGIPTYPPSSEWKDISAADVFGGQHKHAPLALYVHIPYCVTRCGYCDYFASRPDPRNMRTYMSDLVKELGMLSKKSGKDVATIYVGGGTPTTLDNDQIKQLLDAIQQNFTLEEEGEFTVEGSPNTLQGEEGRKKLESMRERGVNRLSMGVQTLSQKVIDICRRDHREEDVRRAIEIANEVGFQTVNVDLMVGLPLQSLSGVSYDVETLIQFGASGVTVYPLGLKKKSAFAGLKESYGQAFPSPEVTFLMKVIADHVLRNAGYEQGLPKYYRLRGVHPYQNLRLRRSPQSELIAVGISSFGYFNDVQYGNTRDPEEYHRLVSAGQLPITKGSKLSDSEALMRRWMILELRTNEGVDIRNFARVFGVTPGDAYGENINALKTLGIVEESSGFLRLTPWGTYFSDNAAVGFFPKKEYCSR